MPGNELTKVTMVDPVWMPLLYWLAAGLKCFDLADKRNGCSFCVDLLRHECILLGTRFLLHHQGAIKFHEILFKFISNPNIQTMALF